MSLKPRHREQSELLSLLRYLGLPWAERTLLWTSVLILAFHTLVLSFGLLGAVVERWLGLHSLAWTLAVWSLWTLWHSVLFERNRTRYLRETVYPYRRAFVFNIVPGAAVAIAQMWRPLLNAETATIILAENGVLPPFSNPKAVLGVTICVVAVALLTSSIHSLGPADAAFLSEYVETEKFVPVESGIYATSRHPMFWSGVLFSAGLSLWLQTQEAYLLAGANCAYALIYNVLEDRRLLRVFGHSYALYKARVPTRVPPFGLISLRRYQPQAIPFRQVSQKTGVPPAR